MTERKSFDIALSFLMIAFVIIKWTAMSLPYFWDEAWSYIPAIVNMAQEGPCLYPGCIDVELYRGHPLLFYFLGASWMKLFGDSLTAMHAFALTISLLTIVSFYRLTLLFVAPRWAFFSVLLLLLQEVFFVQTSFILPEVLVVLLMVLSIYHYLSDHKYAFLIFAGLLGLTKEIGLIIIFGFILTHLLRKRRINADSLWVTLAVLPVAIFYVIQKIKFGWIFFPLHVSLTDFSILKLFSNSRLIFEFLFLEQGRQYVLILLLLLIIFRIIKTYKDEGLVIKLISYVANIALIFIAPFIGAVFTLLILSRDFKLIVKPEGVQQTGLKLFLVLFILLAFFCSANFLMLRYLLVMFPLVLLPVVLFFQALIPKGTKYSVAMMVVTSAVFLGSFVYNFKTRGWHDDASLNYTNIVKVHQEVVAYCEMKTWHKQKINTHFLLHQNLTKQEIGYLRSMPFDSVSYEPNNLSDGEIVIFSNLELNETKYSSIKNNPDYHLDHRFERNKAWSEIYLVK